MASVKTAARTLLAVALVLVTAASLFMAVVSWLFWRGFKLMMPWVVQNYGARGVAYLVLAFTCCSLILWLRGNRLIVLTFTAVTGANLGAAYLRLLTSGWWEGVHLAAERAGELEYLRWLRTHGKGVRELVVYWDRFMYGPFGGVGEAPYYSLYGPTNEHDVFLAWEWLRLVIYPSLAYGVFVVGAIWFVQSRRRRRSGVAAA